MTILRLILKTVPKHTSIFSEPLKSLLIVRTPDLPNNTRVFQGLLFQRRSTKKYSYVIMNVPSNPSILSFFQVHLWDRSLVSVPDSISYHLIVTGFRVPPL